MLKKIVASFLLFVLFCRNINATEFQGKFVDWSVFTTSFGKKNICYMVSMPVKKDGNYNQRGIPYFIITNSDDNIDEINISSGYDYKIGSEVELSFGLKKFNIFTYNNHAWANTKIDDIEIIKEMRKNLDVVVLGVNQANLYSEDTYSLIGFNKAYGKMKEVCEK